MDRKPTSAPFTWDDRFVLGFGPMDRMHEDFVARVAAMLEAPEAQLRERLDDIATHLQEHFGLEDRLMHETVFPPRDCHVDEHAAVMRSVREVQELLARDPADPQVIAAARGLAAALQDWFPGHADYLDSALAHWLCKRSLGGKPVVLRRHLARGTGG